MKNIGTLRQLISRLFSSPDETSPLSLVLDYLYKKDSESMRSKVTLKSTTRAYVPVIDELLSIPPAKPYRMPIMVKWAIDDFEKQPIKYVDVSLLNTKYKAPAEGLQPWGCRKGKKPPKGHYDVNAEKHNQYFAFGFSSWSDVIDTPVMDDTGLSEPEIVAEILWELTFYGWTQKDVEKEIDEIKDSMDQALKEIKEGKCVKLPKKSEKGFDVVIPESVLKQIKELE